MSSWSYMASANGDDNQHWDDDLRSRADDGSVYTTRQASSGLLPHDTTTLSPALGPHATNEDDDVDEEDLLDPNIVAALEDHVEHVLSSSSSSATSVSPDLPPPPDKKSTENIETERIQQNNHTTVPAPADDDRSTASNGTFGTAQFSTLWRGLSDSEYGEWSLKSLENGDFDDATTNRLEAGNNNNLALAKKGGSFDEVDLARDTHDPAYPRYTRPAAKKAKAKDDRTTKSSTKPEPRFKAKDEEGSSRKSFFGFRWMSASSRGASGLKEAPAQKDGLNSSKPDLEEGTLESVQKGDKKNGRTTTAQNGAWQEPTKVDKIRCRRFIWAGGLVLVVLVLVAIVLAVVIGAEGGGDETTNQPETVPPGTRRPTDSPGTTTEPPAPIKTSAPSPVPIDTETPSPTEPPATSTSPPSDVPAPTPSTAVPSGEPSVVPTTAPPRTLFPITCTNGNNVRVRVLIDGKEAVRRCSKIARDPPEYCWQQDLSDDHLAADGFSIPFVWQVCQSECEEWALGDGNVSVDHPEYTGCPAIRP